MSGRRPSAAERRVARAESDILAAHRSAAALARALVGASRAPSSAGAWTLAETGVHLALAAERTLDALRIVAAHGALSRRRAQTVAQRLATAVLLATWRFPAGLRLLPRTDPAGLNPGAGELADRHAAWAASYVEFLHSRPAEYFGHVRHEHPYFGELDTFEWARYLRAHARHHELLASVSESPTPST